MSETGPSAEETKDGIKLYPLKKVVKDKVKYIPGGFKGWHFVSIDEGNLSNSSESANIQAYLRGIQQVPDMIYG